MRKPRDQTRVGASSRRAVKNEKASKGDAAFEVWLQRGLHEIYDAVSSEPVPDELLRLIEEDRKK